MSKIDGLKKPTNNPKGAPPGPAEAPANLLRPPIGESVPFQVRIPATYKRDFKTDAAASGITSSQLFLKVYDFYKGHHA